MHVTYKKITIIVVVIFFILFGVVIYLLIKNGHDLKSFKSNEQKSNDTPQVDVQDSTLSEYSNNANLKTTSSGSNNIELQLLERQLQSVQKVLAEFRAMGRSGDIKAKELEKQEKDLINQIANFKAN